MNWTSWSDFAAMGGYGLYVWGSFGMTALTIVLNKLPKRAWLPQHQQRGRKHEKTIGQRPVPQFTVSQELAECKISH